MRKLVILFAMCALTLVSCAQRTYPSHRYGHYQPRVDRVVRVPQTESNVLVEHTNVTNYYHQTKEEVHHYYIGNDEYPSQTTRSRCGSNYSPYKDDGYTMYNDSYIEQNDVNKWFFFFDFNSCTIKNKEELGHLIDFAKTFPDAKFYIDSYGDIEYGSFSENYMISRKRSTVVAKALMREGISNSRILVKDNGCSSQPYNTNNLNRCVIVRTTF